MRFLTVHGKPHCLLALALDRAGSGCVGAEWTAPACAPPRPDATVHATSQSWAPAFKPNPPRRRFSSSEEDTQRERESCTRGAAGRTIEYLEPVHRCRRLTATASMADAARLFLLVAVTAALAGRSGAFVSFAIFLIFSAHAVGFLCNSVSETRLSPPLDALWLVVSGTGRRRVVRVPHGPGGHRAAEDAGLRVRRRRRLQAHPAERRLLRAGHRQGALLLRRQQLLPAQQPEPAGLRLLRHRHALQQRPQ